MKAVTRAHSPLDPPLPGPGMPPPPVTSPIPVTDPVVPGQGDPVRDPPAGDPVPIEPPRAALPEAALC